MRKFKEQELKEQLGFNEDEVKLIMKAQRIFPELLTLDNDSEGYIINTRKIHEQLKVSKAYSTWIKTMLENLDCNTYEVKLSDSFKGNVDISMAESMSPQELSSKGISSDYYVNLNTAKEIVMIAGASNRANDELKSNSKLCRKYFILMEKAVKKHVEWLETREPQKENYGVMTSELKAYILRNENRIATNRDYWEEADALNLICLGAKAKDIREYIGCQDKHTRDHLQVEYNKYLAKMQDLNILLLRMNIDRETRHKMIAEGFKASFPDARHFLEIKVA